MNKLILTLTMALSVNAYALDCATDQECISATLSLIKKAVKIGGCTSEVNNAAQAAQDILAPNDGSIVALEKCVNQLKRTDKFKKTQAKRIERINKALKAGV